MGSSPKKSEEVTLSRLHKGLTIRKEYGDYANQIFEKDGLKKKLEKLNSTTVLANSKSFNKILKAYNEYNKSFGENSGTIGVLTKEQKRKLQDFVNACDEYLNAKDKQKNFVPKDKNSMPLIKSESGRERYAEISELSLKIKDMLGSDIAMTRRDRIIEGLEPSDNTKQVTKKQGEVKTREKEYSK